MKIASSITELIGATPLLRLTRYAAHTGMQADIYAKIESFNPGSSIKDRVALSMIEQAMACGKLNQESTIVEPTSGNTGIGLAMVAAAKGLHLILTMPENMSTERQALLRFLGAELVLTPRATGMTGAIEKAHEIANQQANAIILDQFSNPANPAVHARTTAQEIIAQQPALDILVAGVGTGGTISGIGQALKAYNPAIKIIAVEPAASAVLSGEPAAPHQLQGIGAGFIPANLHRQLIDSIFKVSAQEAFTAARTVARTEGLLVGISSGAALHAASELSRLPANNGKNIVVILPDSAERYLSTELFQ